MIKRLNKGRVILIGIIILILFVLIFAIVGHIKDQEIKINTYARILQEQRMGMDQLRETNRSLEKVVLSQYNEIRSMEKAEVVSANTEIPVSEPTGEQDTETETDESSNKNTNKVLLGVATVGVVVGNFVKNVGFPVLKVLR